jgi:hypothetical protein
MRISAIHLVCFIISTLPSGCNVIPNRNTITINKVIELDERALEDVNVGIRLEWVR